MWGPLSTTSETSCRLQSFCQTSTRTVSQVAFFCQTFTQTVINDTNDAWAAANCGNRETGIKQSYNLVTQTIKLVASFASGRGDNTPMNGAITSRGSNTPMTSNGIVVVTDAIWHL